MEMSPKWGKHLRWREIMAFICWWQGCWGFGPWGRGLRAWQIAIARSIVIPLLCPSWGPICVSRDWLVALVGVMGLKKVVIVLCGWAGVAVFFNNFFRCLLSSSKKSPRHRWSSYSITFHKRHYSDKQVFFGFHSLMTQLANSLLEVVVYICLPQSVIEVMKFAAALSHYTVHRIDVCPYKVAWWWIHPPMCNKCVL